MNLLSHPFHENISKTTEIVKFYPIQRDEIKTKKSVV